jgi:hypothetical protein
VQHKNAAHFSWLCYNKFWFFFFFSLIEKKKMQNLIPLLSWKYIYCRLLFFTFFYSCHKYYSSVIDGRHSFNKNVTYVTVLHTNLSPSLFFFFLFCFTLNKILYRSTFMSCILPYYRWLQSTPMKYDVKYEHIF